MSIADQKIVIRTEEYLEGERQARVRHEYVEGDVYAMAGASERHNRIAGNVFFHLRNAARGSDCGVFMSDMKLRIDQGSCFYYPDVMLSCDTEDDESYYKNRPCLIAEVSSPSTESIDHREKLLAYKKIPSLKYYLIIASNRQHAKCYQRNDAGEWASGVLDANDILQIQCDDYKASLCLDDIYEDVSWK